MSELAVILVHWKDVAKTRKCLEQVLSWQSIKPLVFLVQNEEIVNQFAEYHSIISIVSRDNLGYGGGNNLALNQAIEQSSYSLLLNTDAEIEESEVIKLLECIKSDSQIFSMGPIIEECNDKVCTEYVGGRDISLNLNTRIKSNELLATEASTSWIPVAYTIGTILMLDNTKLKSVGYFDEDYFFSGEVADLCCRATQLGYLSTTCLIARGKHMLGDHDTRETLYKYYNLRNRLLYCKKHHPENLRKLKWYRFLVKDLLYNLVKFDKEQLRTDVLCLTHSLRGQFGNANRYFQ